MAWWGGRDTAIAATAYGLPAGEPSVLRLALPQPTPAGLKVLPAEVPGRVVALADALEPLAAGANASGGLAFSSVVSDSLRVWQQAARLFLTGAGEQSFAQVAEDMPVAAHAVLRSDAKSLHAPQAALMAFRTAAERIGTDPPPSVEAVLRGYQRQGVAWLRVLANHRGGGILADDMGLGKTLQAICLLAVRNGSRLHLVVCPTSLLGTWERELARFAPTLHVISYHGPGRDLLVTDSPGGAVVVTSYSVLRRDAAVLAAQPWDVLILDEAQQVKNHAAQISQAARRLDATVRLAMTGTPVQNRLEDLWSILDLTNPGLMGTRARFRQRFAVPIEQRRSPLAAAMLHELVAPHVLRRTKSEVATDLPPKQHSLITCTLTGEQAALYRRCVEEAFDTGLGSGIERRGRVLALLTRLKQVCNHPVQLLGGDGPLAGRSGKLDRTSEMLTEVVAAADRALVFTQYRVMGELLSRHLADVLELRHVPFLHGGLPAAQRDRLVRAFQDDPASSQILVLSLRAAGFGLNLTAATHVLHYDRWWNPAVEDQATDRAHRIGQGRPVNVYTLVTGGTLEEHIARLHQNKRNIAAVVAGRGEGALADLPDEDLRSLLELTSLGEDS